MTYLCELAGDFELAGVEDLVVGPVGCDLEVESLIGGGLDDRVIHDPRSAFYLSRVWGAFPRIGKGLRMDGAGSDLIRLVTNVRFFELLKLGEMSVTRD